MTPLDEVDSLPALVSRAARLWPSAEAWIFDEHGARLTFADVERESTRFAVTLAELGVHPGDRVAVMMRNEPAFPLLWLALAKLAAVLVPVNINYRELDGAHVLHHSGARFAVVAPEFTGLLDRMARGTDLERVLTVDELPPADGDGVYDVPGEMPVNIQYTSGTTGAPKGCVLPQRYWLALARGLVDEFPAISDADTILTAQPFHYVDPQWNVAVGLASGAKLVVLDRFHPSSFWDKVRRYEVTWFYCLGLMPTLLARQPASSLDRDHHVRAISASAIPRDLHAELERRWGTPWFEAFGMTETGGDLRVSEVDHDELVGTGCVGTPAPGREAMIADASGHPVPRGTVGELLLRGTGMMHGYHTDPEATARAFHGGWFRTGDLATMDPRGRVFYQGRTKDMIRRSGENISADEVERALALHPAVKLAAVTAEPDELRGEEIRAFVVLDGDAAPDELAEFCAGKLAYFKVPRYWTFTDALPLTPSERVAKGELREANLPRYDRVHRQWR